MTPTRRYYESFLDLFDKLCKLKQEDIQGLDKVKQSFQKIVERIIKYDLFDISLPEDFESKLKTQSEIFDTDRNYFAQSIYIFLGGLLYNFENTDRSINYGRSLEISRTELPFESTCSWKLDGANNLELLQGGLFFQLNSRFLKVSTPEEYYNYKEELRKESCRLRQTKNDLPLSLDLVRRIQELYEKQIQSYEKFIESNYGDIADEFSAYHAEIRIYIIPHLYDGGDILKAIKVYKPATTPIVKVYPYYVDFTGRFKNIEEVKLKPVMSIEGLFNEEDIEKYHTHFSIRSVYYEVHSIFVSHASFDDLKAYLLFLLRAQMLRIEDNEKYVVTINSKRKKGKCKLLFQEVPNTEVLKKVLNAETEPFSFVAFRNRPDDETLELIASLKIDHYIIEALGRDQINNENGEMIHWFIQSRINNLTSLKKNTVFTNGEQLIRRLENCPAGSRGWLEFENICIDIFGFLFSSHFRNYTFKTQSYTHDKIFRRDLIVNNNYSDVTGFWSQTKSEFNSNVIVIDFKNYKEPLEQNEFYLPSKYLNLVTGRFGLILSRKGLGNSAKILQRRMFNRDKELLICLDDQDLIGMIREKTSGVDPTYRLENQKFLLYELE